MMLTVYGSSLCPDCRECKANFDANGIEYEMIDINESLRNLKAFLLLRDKLALFDACKANGSIGIPAVLRADGSVTLDWKSCLKEQGLAVVYNENGPACSLDNRNC